MAPASFVANQRAGPPTGNLTRPAAVREGQRNLTQPGPQ
jgi:hypothetical protein